MLVNELYQGGIRALIAYDPTLFDDFVSPEDPDGNPIPEDLIIDCIIYKYGDSPLFTPEPTVLKYYIGLWSTRRKPLWDRFYRAILEDYDPLENYDRTEKTTDYLTHGESITTDDNVTHGLTTESKISADNASAYQPDSQLANSGTDYRHIGEGHTGTDKRDYDSRIHGNIGVTTSQQMLASELDLIPRLDVIDYIADDFHNEFCLMIYN